MVVEIKVPSAGESVSEAVIAAIIKESGSYVEKDEEILELETDKVNQVIHAPEAGVLTLLVKVDETVAIDQVIGTIDPAAKATAVPAAPNAAKKEVPASPPPASTPSVDGARRTPASFVASIGKETAPPPAPKPTPTLPKSAPVKEGSQTRKRMSGLRRTIAKRLVEVKNNTAMLTTFNEVDMSSVMELRSREKDTFFEKHGVKLGFMSFFVKACVAALKELPDVNAFIDGEEIIYNHSYHIGISVSTEKGLMVPVIRACNELTFAGIEQAIQDYAKKARSGSISIDDLQGGSFTITNGGVFGSMLSTPILNPPQSAILGMHNIVKRAVVVNDQIVIRPMMYLALSYDHRIVDGKEAVTFLVKVKELLEKPDRLLLDF
jgi:2-oxoglutarate dehydrogenase E2 component (dihydrolipoamide succinyltransferase)